MTKISCVYNRTASGRLSLAFATDLWKSLQKHSSGEGENILPLQIYLQNGEGNAEIITNAKTSGSAGLTSNAEMESILVQADVMCKSELSSQSVLLQSSLDAGSLIVDHKLAFGRHDLSVLYPCRESSLLGRGVGPIIVPFGDGHSVFGAAQLAFELAAQLQLPVVLYHTTWAVPGLSSIDASKHMCDAAQTVLATLLDAADAQSVTCKVIVETADDVVEGLLQCALRESARLIVMSRSYKTTVGCYVDQTLRQTPIPIVALASPKRRGL